MPVEITTRTDTILQSSWDSEQTILITELSAGILTSRYEFDKISKNPDPDTPPPGGGQRWLISKPYRWLKHNKPTNDGVLYLLSCEYPELLPKDWLERGLHVPLAKATRDELVRITGFDDLRISLCLNDPDIALQANIEFLQEWTVPFNQLSTTQPDIITYYSLIQSLLKQNEETQLCLFKFLLSKTYHLAHNNKYWLECHLISQKCLTRILKSKSSDVKIRTSLVRFYAYSKAAGKLSGG